jgi:hypothetical protein
LNCSQFCVSDRMFLMAILKVAALQKEGQLNYINALTKIKIQKRVSVRVYLLSILQSTETLDYLALELADA